MRAASSFLSERPRIGPCVSFTYVSTKAFPCSTLTATYAILSTGSISRRGMKRSRRCDSIPTALRSSRSSIAEKADAEAAALYYIKYQRSVSDTIDSAALTNTQEALDAERNGVSPCGWCCACAKQSSVCLRASYKHRALKGERACAWAAMGELLIGAECKVPSLLLER